MALRSFLVMVLCASTVAACSATQAAEPLGATCDQFQSTPTVEQAGEIAADGDFTVVVCSNPSTGFSWEDPQVGDTGVVRLVDRTYQAPGGTLPIVGAAGGEILTFHAVAAGKTAVSTGYSQPWAGGTKGEWTYRLSITVR
jgi:predicted secreted protein